MTLDVQSEVKAGRLNQFVWVRVLGLMVKRPVLTDEVKSIACTSHTALPRPPLYTRTA